MLVPYVETTVRVKVKLGKQPAATLPFPHSSVAKGKSASQNALAALPDFSLRLIARKSSAFRARLGSKGCPQVSGFACRGPAHLSPAPCARQGAGAIRATSENIGHCRTSRCRRLNAVHISLICTCGEARRELDAAWNGQFRRRLFLWVRPMGAAKLAEGAR